MLEKFVTIICPTYNEESYISRCFNSIIRQDYPLERIELFFVDGRSTDNTRTKVRDICEKYDFVKLLDNPFKVVPHALNIGIKKSKGDIIVRIDAHCEYPTNYISTLVWYLFELNADNVGAILNTLSVNEKNKSKAIAFATSHWFGVGNSHFRIGTNDVMEVDTVPFGCFKKGVFERIGLFDEELIRNQDDEFNGRIIKNGGKVFIIPQLVIDYYARDSISKVYKMYYQYGLFKPLVNKKLGKPATLRQFVPVLFVISLFSGFILSFFSKLFFLILLSFLVLYLSIAFTISLKKAINTQKLGVLFYLPVVFFIIHFGYGFGYLKGIYKMLAKQKLKVDINR